MTAWILFLKALALVESGGNPEAIGDGGASWGKYQLQAAYVQDASEWGLSNVIWGDTQPPKDLEGNQQWRTGLAFITGAQTATGNWRQRNPIGTK